jgi:hypothetical protein
MAAAYTQLIPGDTKSSNDSTLDVPSVSTTVEPITLAWHDIFLSLPLDRAKAETSWGAIPADPEAEKLLKANEPTQYVTLCHLMSCHVMHHIHYYHYHRPLISQWHHHLSVQWHEQRLETTTMPSSSDSKAQPVCMCVTLLFKH